MRVDRPDGATKPFPDLTKFYAATEAAAAEVRRLLETGQLAGLVAILREAGLRLELEAYSEAMRHAEYLGELLPGEGAGEERFPYEDFLADRVETRLELPTGETRVVRMPDHICPRCGHRDGNYIVDKAKTCAACRFQW